MPATAEHFFDWKFAQKVWFEMKTWETAEAEWNRHASDFEPWLKLYKQDRRKALDALKQYPEDKRKNIERGHDVQLAFDHWFDQVYSSWYNGYAHDAAFAATYSTKKAPTFDDYLASYGSRPSCVPQTMLDECGPVPDWRSPKRKAEAQAMMQKADREAAEAEAKRAAKYGAIKNKQ